MQVRMEWPREMAAEPGCGPAAMITQVTALELQHRQELAPDRFDGPGTCYLVSRDAEGCLDGYARLLPTTAPYPLAELYPGLLNGLVPPRSADVWELSRFAAVDLESAVASPRLGRDPSSSTAVGLLRAALEVAAQQGASRVVTLSPLAMERLLRRAGYHAYRAGPPALVEGKAVFACLIPLA